MILTTIIAEARRRNLRRLTLEATRMRPVFYLRHGFVAVREKAAAV
ncbi:Uncharacterised protein [Raoultella planticola]|uniref:N-acetyltransferase domain-containing protein n=1 Tax=Raoultella planticola TaxID=575 RepID=A0A485CQ52_RAOPL|nr:Uncharacterised protein [Raoultella planticola]